MHNLLRMETPDELDQRIRRERLLGARLRLAMQRLEEAQRERIWAIVEAHQAGLSVRQIATAPGLSPSRVHQLLGSDEAREIPRWLSHQRGREAAPSQVHSHLQIRLAGELEALRRTPKPVAFATGNGFRNPTRQRSD